MNEIATETKLCLEAQGLKKSYADKLVVKGIDLAVNEGEVVGLLGPNGAGKTTSFYMMVGLVRPDAGTVKLGGEEITDHPLHARALQGIGYLAQEASIFRELSAEDNIYAVLENRHLPKAKKKNLLNALIRDFGLEHIRRSKGSSLSGGERRRVEIARVLALDPRFILLDEPFASVDPLAVKDMQAIIKDLKGRNIGILITDHNARETFEIVDRAYLINFGELVVSGTPQEIVASEKAKDVYLGRKFSIDGSKQ